MALPIDSPNTPEEVRQPRKARLPRWLFLLVGSIAVLIVAGWWTQRPLARIPLPNGGELILIDAQYGPEYRRVPHVGLGDRLRHFWSNPQSSPVPPPYIMHAGNPRDSPRLWLVFEKRNTTMENPWISTLESGQSLDSPQISIFNGSGIPTPRLITGLRCYPRRARHVELRISMGKAPRQTITTTVPNPFPVSDAPRWTPEPVPQTRQLKSREIVLESLGANLRNRNIQPVIKVHETGMSPDAFKIERQLSDATGNMGINNCLPLSEPVWKIHATATPNELYPFSAAEYLSFGHATVPGPGEYRALTLPPDSGLGAAFLVGTGSYHIQPEKEPPVVSVPPSPKGAMVFPTRGITRVDSEGIYVVIFGPGSYPKESPESRHLMRAVVGSANIPFNSHGWSGDPEERFGLSGENLPPVGTDMEIQLLLSHEESADFYVQPPH